MEHIKYAADAQHTDLHPGNILVRVRPKVGPAQQQQQQGQRAQRGGEAGSAAVTPPTPRGLDDALLAPIEDDKSKTALQLVRC